jgi:hypothetical protein
MSYQKEYGLFICHAWKYDSDYRHLAKLLKIAPNFKCRNFSMPETDPSIDPETPDGQIKLTAALDAQIRAANIVIVIAGMYVNYKFWIQREIQIAQRYAKPLIGVRPFGHERLPTLLDDIAGEVVNWNTFSIVEAIRNNAV